MSSDHRLTATVTIPNRPRRLLANLREAVLSTQQDPQHPERQGRALTDLAIVAKGDQIELTCEFGNPPTSKE